MIAPGSLSKDSVVDSLYDPGRRLAKRNSPAEFVVAEDCCVQRGRPSCTCRKKSCTVTLEVVSGVEKETRPTINASGVSAIVASWPGDAVTPFSPSVRNPGLRAVSQT